MTCSTRIENETNEAEHRPLDANQASVLDGEHRFATKVAVCRKPGARVAALALAGAPLLVVFGCGTNPAHVLPAEVPSVSAVQVQSAATTPTCNQVLAQMAPVAWPCPGNYRVDPSQVTVDPLAAAGVAPH
jgi:hypothetical protein